MEHNEQEECISLQLYEYLTNAVVGSERAVSYRRLFFKVFDLTFESSDIKLISSGSKAEGLDLPGSDIDFMVLLKQWKVYEGSENIGDIVIDATHANPGFTLLRVVDNKNINLPLRTYPFSFTECGFVLANSDFRNTVLEMYHIPHTHIQGPSFAIEFSEIDTVPCLQCKTWPNAARSWLCRSRHSGWPTTTLTNDIINFGVLVVPVGSKFYSDEADCFEWRFSFSLAEKVLIHSFNQTQLLVYSLLKIFLKEIINKDQSLAKLLCSYFMKTLLFWILEDVNQSSWIPKKLLYWFIFCIKRLKLCLICNYIPNYFIPEHNLIDGKISNESRIRLCTVIDNLLSQNGWKCLLSTRSFQGFALNIRTISVIPQKEPFKILYPFLIYGNQIGLYCLYKSFELSQNQNVSKLTRSLSALHLSQCIIACTGIHAFKNFFFGLTNNHYYLSYKDYLASCLIGTYRDAVWGWFELARFYFTNKEYDKMAEVLHTISTISFMDFICQTKSHFPFSFFMRSKNNYFEYKSFLKRIRHERAIAQPNMIIEGFNMKYNESHIHIGLIYCPPDVTLHYLNFLCYLKKKNYTRCQFDLDQIKAAMNNTNVPLRNRLGVCMTLHRAYALYPMPYRHDPFQHDIVQIVSQSNVDELLKLLLPFLPKCTKWNKIINPILETMTDELPQLFGCSRQHVETFLHMFRNASESELMSFMMSGINFLRNVNNAS